MQGWFTKLQSIMGQFILSTVLIMDLPKVYIPGKQVSQLTGPQLLLPTRFTSRSVPFSQPRPSKSMSGSTRKDYAKILRGITPGKHPHLLTPPHQNSWPQHTVLPFQPTSCCGAVCNQYNSHVSQQLSLLHCPEPVGGPLGQETETHSRQWICDGVSEI